MKTILTDDEAILMKSNKHWTFGSNENYRYALKNEGRIGVFITYGPYQFGFGVRYFNHILSKGEPRIKKLIIDLPFIMFNITFHKS